MIKILDFSPKNKKFGAIFINMILLCPSMYHTDCSMFIIQVSVSYMLEAKVNFGMKIKMLGDKKGDFWGL